MVNEASSGGGSLSQLHGYLSAKRTGTRFPMATQLYPGLWLGEWPLLLSPSPSQTWVPRQGAAASLHALHLGMWEKDRAGHGALLSAQRLQASGRD